MSNRRTTPLIPWLPAPTTRANTFILAVFVIFVASPAIGAGDSSSAEGNNEIYVEYSGGPSYFGNEGLTAKDLPGATLTGRVTPHSGFNVGGAIGMRVHELVRTELQLGYRRSQVAGISIEGGSDNGHGSFGLLSVMANTYLDYDFNLGVIPYVGAGVGWGLIDINARNTNRTLDVVDDDTVFVWSVMVGGTVPINDVIDVSFGYRYIATTDSEFDSKVITTGDPVQSTRLDAEFDSHEAVVALRYKF